MPPRRAAAAASRSFRELSASSVVEISSDGESDAFVPPGAKSNNSQSDASLVPSSPSPSPSAVSESGSDDGKRGVKRKRAQSRRGKVAKEGMGKGKAGKVESAVLDIEDCVPRPHGRAYHSVDGVREHQQALLDWFEGVRDKRGMPWRKRYDPALSDEEKGQRAYEIWVSEVMLQQTQVATVIDYWNRWMERWPTIADLAKANIEDVNAAWRGLGYYRRAKSLLAGAGVIMGSKKYNQRLPSDPDVLEKDVPGVGRYTAGAICSMAYGVRTPIVDGNIHRVLTRLLGVYATQTAPETIRFLWSAAEALVDALPRGLGRGIAGDWNQALMELGATVCRPTGPACGECPLREACHAYSEAESRIPPPPPQGEECTLCEPIPEIAVASFPMKKVKKASRVENEIVIVTEWRGESEREWLLTKRPDKGLLAGLFEPPTLPVPATSTAMDRLAAAKSFLSDLVGDLDEGSEDAVMQHKEVAPVTHIFSHINMTYHVHHVVLSKGERPKASTGEWLDLEGVAGANVGTGVKKCWEAVYGRWGSGEVQGTQATKGKGRKAGGKAESKPAAKRKRAADGDGDVKPSVNGNGKVVKKVCMPAMPKAKTVKAEEVEEVKEVKGEVIVID